jgi:hypothetical protein
VALAWAGVSGCAYSTRRLTDFPSARSIAVLPFENTGFRRDLELRLSQAVVTEIRARTSLAVTTRDRADLLLSGRMSAEEYAIGIAADGSVLQKRLEGTLAVEVRDRASGRLLRRSTVRATEEYRPGLTGEMDAGTAEWTRRVAEQVVQALEVGF